MRSVIVLMLFIVLSGCESRTAEFSVATSDKSSLRTTTYAYLWVDPETKCEYVADSNLSNFTPRLNREHVQICR